jgi:two-component system, sensor histidine kinase PdtaS
MKAQPDRDDRLGVFRRLSAGLVVGISVLAAAIILLTILSIVQDYRDAVRQAETETQTVARALEQHSERVFDAVRFRLRLVQNIIGPIDWQRIAADPDLHSALAELADRPFMHSVWLFDETGLGRASSRFLPALPSEVGDRDYFAAHRNGDGGVFIGQPITGRRTGDPVLSASIRLSYPDGRFAGVAAVFIRPDYFEAFYRDLRLGRGSVIELVRADGAFLIREASMPVPDSLNNRNDLPAAMAGKEAGIYRAVSRIDGVERIASFRRLLGLPIFVNVGMSIDDALDSWYVSLAYRLALATLALLAILGFGRVTVLRARAVESEVARRTEELQRSVREKEVLLREVHHRVKNNLQMIASMLRLTARKAALDSQPIFADVARRVTAIGQAYNQLYRVGEVSALNLAEYIDTLAQGVAAGFGAPRVALRIELEQITVDIDTALPVGLVALELVTNAYKHGFPGERDGEVTVKLQRHEEFARLIVADNGVGSGRRGTDGSGLMLIEALAGQVDGKLKIGARPGGGTKARLTFKIERGGMAARPQPVVGQPRRAALRTV